MLVECAICHKPIKMEETCLRKHPDAWTHKKCCEGDHRREDAQTKGLVR